MLRIRAVFVLFDQSVILPDYLIAGVGIIATINLMVGGSIGGFMSLIILAFGFDNPGSSTTHVSSLSAHEWTFESFL